MLTKMTEEDWEIVLEVFDAGQSERANPDTTIVSSWRHCITFTVHSVTWRTLPDRVWQVEQHLEAVLAAPAARVCSRHSCSSWRRPARARR